ncbi:hypothetical protein ACJ41O_008197 [Fusarium nematophilum]
MVKESRKRNLLLRLFAGRGKADSDEEGEGRRARRLEGRLTSLTSLGRHSPQPASGRDKLQKEKNQGAWQLLRSKTAPALPLVSDSKEQETALAGTGEIPTATEDGDSTDTKPTSKPEDNAVEDEDVGELSPQLIENQGSPASAATSPAIDVSDPDVAAAIWVLTVVTADCSSFGLLSHERQDELLTIVRQMPVLLTPEGRRKNPKRADNFLAEVYDYPELATWGPIESFDELCQNLEFLCRARAKPMMDKHGIGVV